MFLHIPYRCKIEQLVTLQHNGMTNSEMEMCMWKYRSSSVKIIWEMLSLKIK